MPNQAVGQYTYKCISCWVQELKGWGLKTNGGRDGDGQQELDYCGADADNLHVKACWWPLRSLRSLLA